MAKKEAHHTHSAEHHVHHSTEHPSAHLEETILHNLVELQKVHTNLAERFDKLSGQISQLLGLFEGAARSFAKQSPGGVASDKDREFLDKIDKLLEQNKTIAKGLMLMDDKMREKVYGQPQQMQQMQQSMQPYPRPTEVPRPLPKI